MAEQISVKFTWRLPDGKRARATFEAEVVAYEYARDRWLCILRTLQTSLDEVPAAVANYIRELPGHWVYIPTEGKDGLTLPMKLETLLGKPRFFYTEDPRRPVKE